MASILDTDADQHVFSDNGQNQTIEALKDPFKTCQQV